MKSNRNGNIYGFNAASALKTYGAFAKGTPNSTLAVLSARKLSDAATSALANSAKRLGFGADILWVQTIADGGDSLDAADLRKLLIGCDPVAMAITDTQSARLVEEAFATPCKPDAVNHVFGRTTVAFAGFEAMLSGADEKQKAWSLLKKLTS